MITLSNILLAVLLLNPLSSVPSTKNFDLNNSLHNYLINNNTSSFLISEKGEIIIDQEFEVQKGYDPKSLMYSNLLLNGLINNRSQEDVASIQKSLVSVLIGIAQQKGLIDINNSVSLYIGKWTQLEEEKENLITIKNLLTMTSGLDTTLNYSSDPGSQWFYNSRAYSYLIDVLEKSSGIQVNDLSSEWLFKDLEMQETFWKERRKGIMGFSKDSSKYGLITTAKDLLKFGEFILNGGEIGTNHIISDIDFFDDSFSKSQDFNEAYGYLWWLNNTTSFMTWDKDLSSGNLFPKAPEETILALGLGSRILAIIPSQEIVLVRLGSFPNDPNFNNNLWEYIQ